MRQTEHLIDEKLHGDSMDGVLARKVHETGPLASFLSGLATKHEVEAMRKVTDWGIFWSTSGGHNERVVMPYMSIANLLM